MLLETLDIKKNDIIIYSQNIFNPDNNFKIIFKDDEKKSSRKISFDDVCRFVNEFAPKNLIVYRLLTNIENLEIEPSKYGVILSINDQYELIYFDPVFAVKELERYSRLTNLNNLRFRIQQVGLTTLSSKGDLLNFAEIYAIDLEAMEAKFQNDKVFADAILTIGASKSGSERKRTVITKKEAKVNNEKSRKVKEASSFAEKIKQNQQEITAERTESMKEIEHEISEDKDFDYTQIMKMSVKNRDLNGDTVKSKEATVMTGKKTTSSFSEFLKKKRSDVREKKNEQGEKDFIDLFKSSSPLKEYIHSKEDKKVVLRLDKK